MYEMTACPRSCWKEHWKGIEGVEGMDSCGCISSKSVQDCPLTKRSNQSIRNEANGELVQPKDISVKGWTVVMEIDKHIQ